MENWCKELKIKLQKQGVVCSDAEVEEFAEHLLRKLWNEYEQECMDQRVIIENQVKDLPIVIPNGTVGKAYDALFNFAEGLVESVWLEGAE